jgi:hypothetical protein
MLNTFNNPNYAGELLGITPTDTPLLSSIGLTAGQSTESTIFTWQSYDLRVATPPGSGWRVRTPRRPRPGPA